MAAGLCVYVAIAVQRETVMGRAEVFPFASWSLFSMVANTRMDYALRVQSIDQQPLASPQYMERLGNRLPVATSHAAYVSVQKLGTRLAEGDAAKAERLHVESLIFQGRPAVYEVVRRRFDVLDRWHGVPFAEERVIATFDSAAGRSGGER